jgi:hypothetical protein
MEDANSRLMIPEKEILTNLPRELGHSGRKTGDSCNWASRASLVRDFE